MFYKLRYFAKRKITIALAVTIACLLLVTPVLAGSTVGDIVWAAFSFVITGVCKMILGGMQAVASLFLSAMSYDITLLMEKHYFAGFELFAYGIRVMATSLASLMFVWQLVVMLCGPMLGVQQQQSTISSVVRALVFIPLTYAIQPLALSMLKQFQRIYNAFMSVYQNANSGTINVIPNGLNTEEFISKDTASIPDIVDETWIRVISVIFSCCLLIIILIQFLQLVLEMAQRFVIMVFYVYLSPLAVACGVSPSASQITKSALNLFISSGILWVMNVWSISIIMGMFAAFPESINPSEGGSPSAFFLLVVLTYAAIKIAQQLDDIFNAVGASNIRLSGSMFTDLMSLGQVGQFAKGVVKTIGKAGAGLKNYAENGWGGNGKDGNSQGSSSTNPVQPNPNQKVNSGTTATGGRGLPAPTMQTTADGQKPKSWGGQVLSGVVSAVKATPPGQIYTGTRKTAENIANAVKSHSSEAQMAGSNNALSEFHAALNTANPQARAKAIAGMDPAKLDDPAVKNYVGQAIGLGSNQRVESLSRSSDGQLTATVSTRNADGNVVQLSRVSGINDALPGASSAGASTMSPSTMEGAHQASYTPKQLDDLAENGLHSIDYTDIEGKKQTATITANGDGRTGNVFNQDLQPQRSFTAKSTDGNEIEFIAPAKMTTAEVASMAAGKASPETIEKFNKGGGDAREFDRIAGKLSIDRDNSMDLHKGQAFENSADTSIVMKSSEGGPVTITRSGSTASGDTWTMRNEHNDDMGAIVVPTGTGAREVVDYVRTGHDSGAQNARAALDMATVEEIQFNHAGHRAEQAPVNSANNTVWDNDYRAELSYSKDYPDDPIIKVNYAQKGEEGRKIKSQVSFVPVKAEDGIATYQAVRDGEIVSEFKVDRNHGIEEVVANLPLGYSTPGVKSPMESLRKKLGMETTYSAPTAKDAVFETLQQAREAKKGTSNNPVGKNNK